jgi:hypothetical protein
MAISLVMKFRPAALRLERLIIQDHLSLPHNESWN